MALFRLKLVNFVITIAFLKCLVDGRSASAKKESENELFNSFINEIREKNVKAALLQRTKRELGQMKTKIDRMVFEIERTRKEKYTSEELFLNVEKRHENDLLRFAQRRLRRNRNKIDKLDGTLDEIKYSNNLALKRNLNLLLDSYKVHFVAKYPTENSNLNRILVKRKVPKNVPSSIFEFDNALKTLYRPIVRLHASPESLDETRSRPNYQKAHKRKRPTLRNEPNRHYEKGKNKIKTILHGKEINKTINGLVAQIKKLVPHTVYGLTKSMHKTDNFEPRPALRYEPYGYYGKEKDETEATLHGQTLNKAVKRIVANINKLVPQRLHDLTNTIQKNIHNVFAAKPSLRQATTTPEGPSVEIHDIYAPGKKTYDILINEDNHLSTSTTKQPFWYPNYKYYDFWTYSKSIMQDDCPPNQIKVFNLCISTPPH